MPSATKYHIFKEKHFQGIVYCDYCGKLLWGLSRQGVECSECGYSCHTQCSDKVIQCRPARRWSPDSLSVTDSEAESLSKYSTQSPRQSLDAARFHSDLDNSSGQRRPRRLSSHNILDELPPISRSLSSSKIASHQQQQQQHQHQHSNSQHSINHTLQQQQQGSSSEEVRSPTFSGTGSTSGDILINSNHYRSKQSLNKSYRKSLKQQLQTKNMPTDLSGGNNNNNDLMSPHATAKAFTRLVARSRAFFNVSHVCYDIYQWKKNSHSIFVCSLWISLCLYPRTVLLAPPLLIWLLYSQTGIRQNQTSSQILLPRYDDSNIEYYTNLEDMQHSFIFLIRFYDNLAYHLQHITLDSFTYKILFLTSTLLSVVFYYFGRWLVLAIGLMVLLNKTWLGNVIEVGLQFLMEVIQTTVDVFQRLTTSRGSSGSGDSGKNGRMERKHPIQVSVYENQRWWAGNGFTSQLLRSERTGWSNITGLEPLPSKEEMPSPTHYTWADDEWHLDTTGPWIDDALEIVTMVECDENGWVYSDHKWANPRARPDSSNKNDKALTRRRRWYRKAIPIPTTTSKKSL